MSAQENKGGAATYIKDNLVFCISLAITVAVVVWALAAGDSFVATINGVMSALTGSFDWLYLWGATFLIVFSLAIAISPYGKTKMGRDDEKPAKSTLEWFAMLFSAGMGVGLIFWGVAEPLSHYLSPMSGIEPMTEEAMRFSLRSCFMHWGLHPWALYSVVGMALGYFAFRLGKKSLISSTLEPVIGKQSKGAIGIIVDIYVAILTVMGVATSFGMGCIQISTGLNYLFGVPSTVYVLAIIVGLTCVVYTWSVVSGIDRGMQLLSNGTMLLCAVLMILVFVLGPSIDIVRGTLVGIGDFLVNFLQDSVRLAADDGDKSWILGWRVFYWAWWLSWSPFVGIFLARISRGRTIREFVLGSIIAPTIMGILWFGIFGGAAFSAADGMTADQISTVVGSPETSPFVVFGQFPIGIVLSIIALVVLFGFFVTSANSATYVLSMLTSRGDINPPMVKKVFWGVLLAFVAFAFMMSGGVSGIQTIAIIISFPFFFIIIVMAICMVLAIHKEHKQGLSPETAEPVKEEVPA